MMFRFRSMICLLSLGAGLASCRGPLPNEADLDHAYSQSQALAKQDIIDLDQRRARGEITAAEYTTEKQAIMDRIAARANEMVLTQTALVQSRRQAVGLPTPESPQDISVPQAGTLATGTARRQFNDSGGADGTGAGLGFLPGGSIGGLGNAGFVGGEAAPTTAVATPVAAPVSTPVIRAPAPTPVGVTPTRPGGGGGGRGT